MKKSIFLIVSFFYCIMTPHCFGGGLFRIFEDWHDNRLSCLSQQELNALLNPSYPRTLALKGGLILGLIGALCDYKMSFDMSPNNRSLKAHFQDHAALVLLAVTGLCLGHWRGLCVQRKIKNGEIPNKN